MYCGVVAECRPNRPVQQRRDRQKRERHGIGRTQKTTTLVIGRQFLEQCLQRDDVKAREETAPRIKNATLLNATRTIGRMLGIEGGTAANKCKEDDQPEPHRSESDRGSMR